MEKRLHSIKKMFISLIILLFIIFATPIKGTFSLTTSLSNSTVNEFTFIIDSQIVDNTNNNDTDQDTTNTKIEGNTKTGDDTNINLLLVGMLVDIGGLAFCWIKENKQTDDI